MVERVPSEHKTLNSMPRITEKMKKEKNTREREKDQPEISPHRRGYKSNCFSNVNCFIFLFVVDKCIKKVIDSESVEP